jgi:hypothetical protein
MRNNLTGMFAVDGQSPEAQSQATQQSDAPGYICKQIFLLYFTYVLPKKENLIIEPH